MKQPNDIFPRQGEPLAPISPVIPPDDTAYGVGLKRMYTRATRHAFPGREVAVSVVRGNLHNRLEHAKRNYASTVEAIRHSPVPQTAALFHYATSTPEERVEAFMNIPQIRAVEAHAELLNVSVPSMADFPEGRIAINALVSDFNGTVIEEDPSSRIKVTRVTEVGGEEFAVVRSKIDGLAAEIDGRIELKIRRSGAVALAAVDDRSVLQAIKILKGLHTMSHANPQAIAYCRHTIEEYLRSEDSSYTPFVQSYYLARTSESTD